jgi:hypothetical protein
MAYTKFHVLQFHEKYLAINAYGHKIFDNVEYNNIKYILLLSSDILNYASSIEDYYNVNIKVQVILGNYRLFHKTT